MRKSKAKQWEGLVLSQAWRMMPGAKWQLPGFPRLHSITTAQAHLSFFKDRQGKFLKIELTNKLKN
jgi:hypothetical protein